MTERHDALLAALIATRRELARPGGWTQGPMALNDAGELVHPFYDGTQRCLRAGSMIGAAHVAQFQGIYYLGTGGLATPWT